MSRLTLPRSGIGVVHPDIIEGLEAIYAILINCGYIQNTDVQVPPHGLPKDPINVAGLRATGLDPQTIELIARLPCFTRDILEEHQQKSGTRDAIPVAPSSSAISDLVGSNFSGITETDSGNEELSPLTLRITRATDKHGNNLAYDLATSKYCGLHSNIFSSGQTNCAPENGKPRRTIQAGRLCKAQTYQTLCCKGKTATSNRSSR